VNFAPIRIGLSARKRWIGCSVAALAFPFGNEANSAYCEVPMRRFLAFQLPLCLVAMLVILSGPRFVSAQVAAPSATYLSFNPAPIGIAAGSAQTLTASFAVTGFAGQAIEAQLHYGRDYSIGATACSGGGGAATCTVNVTFQPTLPGTRKDAIFLMNGSTRLATVLLNGLGQGPMSLLQPGAFTTGVPSSSFATSYYIYQSVTDENGTVYLLPSGNDDFILSISKGGVATQIPLTSPPYFWSIGIDGAGVLYIFGESKTVTTYDTVQGIQGTYLIPYSGTSTDWYPGTVDGQGNFYIVDQIANNGELYEFNANRSSNYQDILNPGVLQPETAAVDSQGNAFVGGYQIDEVSPAGITTQVNTVGAWDGLAVDAANTLYATRYEPSGGVAELPASNYSTPIASIDSHSSPLGVSLGSDGTVFVSNYVNLDVFNRSTTETIDFGEVSPTSPENGSAASIYNGGNESLTISQFMLTGAGFSLDASQPNDCVSGTVLAPGALCLVNTTFTPGHAGMFSGTLTVVSNSLNGTNVTQTIQLTGTSNGIYDVLNPNALVFPAQAAGTSQTLPVTLTNQGHYYSSTIYSVTVNSPAFTVSQGTCATPAPPNTSCQLQVTFQPTSAQPYSGTATIVTFVNGTNLASQTLTLSLSGTGTAGAATLSATSLSFGSELVGTQSVSKSVTLTNTGGVPLAISGIALGGMGASSYVFANNCGSSLAASAACTIHGHFTPTTTGLLPAVITITDNAANSPQTITLSGTGGTPAVVTLSATSLSFGVQAVGTQSASQSVTLTNTGGLPLAITSVALGGTGGSSYVFANNCGSSLAASAACTIHGHFTPTATGSLPAVITITDNAAGSPQTIALSGTGGTPPLVSLSSTSLSFGSRPVGTQSNSQSVTLINTGGSPLSIQSIAVTGTDAASFVFANNCGTTLAASASCTIHGHFTPAAAGPLTAAITLTDSATGLHQNIALSGTGQ